MRGGLPSGTSLLVSFARGLGVGDPVLDPVAKALLPVWLGRVADAPRHLGGAGAFFYRRAVRATTFGLIDHMVLRTEAIDAHLASSLQSGIDQLVILGAGLDARYVAVDLEKDRFSEKLERMGFRSGDRSVWIWEGVAMYLPVDAIHGALEQLTSLAAAGSELAMTYRVPGVLPFGAFGRATIPALFAAAGEPLKSTFEPRELASTIAPEWDVVYDEDARGWQMLTGSIANPQRSFLAERLAIVKRRA